jgi:multidrug efflux pump subunit AcrA (membrane-fusion protein)
MRRRILYIGAAAGAIAAAGIVSWEVWFTNGQSGGDVPLRTQIVERGDITRVVSATGYLSARADVEVRGGKSGTIEEILVKEGYLVREGQVLARFEDDQEELNLLEAAHALEEAEVALESARVSRASPQQIRAQERQLAECRLQLALRQDALDDTVVTALDSTAAGPVQGLNILRWQAPTKQEVARHGFFSPRRADLDMG